MRVRVGQGFDVHRVSDDPTRRLVLGGVTFPEGPGLVGHSDADVVAHATIDALLGAAGLGDIGEHFPDTDPRYARRGLDRAAPANGDGRSRRGLGAGQRGLQARL